MGTSRPVPTHQAALSHSYKPGRLKANMVPPPRVCLKAWPMLFSWAHSYRCLWPHRDLSSPYLDAKANGFLLQPWVHYFDPSVCTLSVTISAECILKVDRHIIGTLFESETEILDSWYTSVYLQGLFAHLNLLSNFVHP